MVDWPWWLDGPERGGRGRKGGGEGHTERQVSLHGLLLWRTGIAVLLLMIFGLENMEAVYTLYQKILHRLNYVNYKTT